MTGKFLRMDVNLKSTQGLSLDLNLQYPESHEMFCVFSLTKWDVFFISLLSCWKNNYHVSILQCVFSCYLVFKCLEIYL